MLEIRKNKFTRSYENTFFREFSKNIADEFKKRDLSGVLIGSPYCTVNERLQIDALLITNDVVCIIDFKNFEGKIKLPSTENFATQPWIHEGGSLVKGGSSVNPLAQLGQQKSKFGNVYNRYIKDNIAQGDYCDVRHVVTVVCFQKKIELVGAIPGNKENTCHILDKGNYLDGILDIIDVTDKESVSLHKQESFDAFIKIFEARPYEPENTSPNDLSMELADTPTVLKYDQLYETQKDALSKIKKFIENKEQNVFILKGTANSGATTIIPFIEDIAYKSGRSEVLTFAVTGLAAKNLLKFTVLEDVNSIYSYIYGGKTEDEDDSEVYGSPNEDEDKPNTNKIVPLKSNTDSEDAVYIIDESHLLSNSFYKADDGLQFGTGFLLNDFIKFVDINKTNRKVIFIGDPLQLLRGKKTETTLNQSYIKDKFAVNVDHFQLIDNPDYSLNNKEVLKCVEGIRSNKFILDLKDNKNLVFVNKNETLDCFRSLLNRNADGHILYYQKEDVHRANQEIKNLILKNGEDIAPGDLVIFNNTISACDESDSLIPRKIFNGQFAKVTWVSPSVIEKVIPNRPDLPTLKFREVSLTLDESGRQVRVLSLENYRLNPKPPISKKEITALSIIKNLVLSDAMKTYEFEKSNEYITATNSDNYRLLLTEKNNLEARFASGERVKMKLNDTNSSLKREVRNAKQQFIKRIESTLLADTTSEYFKFSNVAYLKFGWAMTIHKSQSYKWDEVILEFKPGGNTGEANEDNFRRIYTGMTRSRNKISLINYDPITPKKSYYAYIAPGESGIVDSWEDCKKYTSGISGSRFKSFKTYEEAAIWISENQKGSAGVAYFNEQHIATESESKINIDRDSTNSKTNAKKPSFYAYQVNGNQGVTNNWADCAAIISGLSGVKTKKFESEAEAYRWLDAGANYSMRHTSSIKGIYFDAGTGGGMGVEISVTNENGRDMLGEISPAIQLNSKGKHLLPGNVTNNYGELLACKYALELAIKNNILNIFGDSKLVINYWSKGVANVVSNETRLLVDEVKKLRVTFENMGGSIEYVSGGSNPADLGFHKS